jgi:hypothetical protein
MGMAKAGDPDWRYLSRFSNNSAEVEVEGQKFTIVHRAFGILGPRFYVGMREGRDVTRPFRRLSPVLRALARIAKTSDRPDAIA